MDPKARLVTRAFGRKTPRSAQKSALLALLLLFPAPTRAEPALASLETAFDAAIDIDEQARWLRILASEPNHIGSPHDRRNAEMVLSLFRNWGWDAHIESFSILFPTPKRTLVEMMGPQPLRLGGQEPAVEGDDSTKDLSRALPPYFAFQGDGDVTGPVIYVNRGMPADYAELARRGIDVKGKIILARNGGGWRGLKVKLAEQHGAIGCLIYSDPAEHGFVRGKVYPEGGWRPGTAVERGSVANTSLYPGDPLTPGVAATPGQARLTRVEAPTLARIPALPISSDDALRLMKGFGGPDVPTGWVGALPIPYRFGSNDTIRVHLAVQSEWSRKEIYNVIARIDGARFPDQWVVRGNHRDAWVFGAADPLSGQVAMLGEAKAIGTLLKTGWRPQRTIIYASWGGEEAGLVGSTEWVEAHAAELRAKARLYVNTDSNGRGTLNYGGSPELTRFVNQVATDIRDPVHPVSLQDRQRARRQAQFPGDAVRGDLPIGVLGSGSDFVPFLDHIGVPTIDMDFAGEDSRRGSHHSAYDTYHHYMTFDDPGLLYVNALSRVAGRTVLRYADEADALLRFGDLARAVGGYVREVGELADRRTNDDPGFDPLDLTGLVAAAAYLEAEAVAYDRAANAAPTPDAEDTARLSGLLGTINQLLLDEEGLPGRPWYRNLIYAPGLLTGDTAKTLPGIREGIEAGDRDAARLYLGKTSRALRAYADRLAAARRLRSGVVGAH